MHSLALECGPADREWLLGELYERGTLGVIEHDLPGGAASLEAFFEAPFDTFEFTRFGARWAERAPDVDSWREPWEPVCVGERFFLVPDWRDDPAPRGRLRLAIHARQASGSGYHPPTQLMLRAMEQVVGRGSFLDVGAGSGILCDAARLLGANPVWGCDIDPEAAAEARENIPRAALFVGSARAVRGGVAAVAAANLNAQALLALSADLTRVLAPGAALILGGFKQRNLDRVTDAFRALAVAGILEDGEWRCVILRRARPI
ncbi:MAG: 50S ribosomal protein L11 methyltransferase [Bryobacteraceae bacterium]